MELGAKKFPEQRTAGPLLIESAPAPPSAGFNVAFEDLMLNTVAGAPLIFARLWGLADRRFADVNITGAASGAFDFVFWAQGSGGGD